MSTLHHATCTFWFHSLIYTIETAVKHKFISYVLEAITIYTKKEYCQYTLCSLVQGKATLFWRGRPGGLRERFLRSSLLVSAFWSHNDGKNPLGQIVLGTLQYFLYFNLPKIHQLRQIHTTTLVLWWFPIFTVIRHIIVRAVMTFAALSLMRVSAVRWK